MTLPHGTGTGTRPWAGIDTGAGRSTVRVPDASLTATVAGEGA